MKIALILAVILVAFGTVGRMDYEDAVALEAAQQTTQTASAEE